MDAPIPGQAIHGWVIEKRLGTGAMGSVYLCHSEHDPSLKGAVKILVSEELPHARERFRREAQVLARLAHPHVARFLGFHTDPHLLVMEFVEGESLYHAADLSEDQAVSIAKQLADALNYLHGHGVWHRDVKPDNIILDKNGDVRLVDFGIAVDEDWQRLTATGMFLGTLPYVPPETLLSDDTIDAESWDVYSLGVVLYEMLTGKLAFVGDDPSGVRTPGIVVVEKERIDRLDPGPRFPGPLRALVRGMTEQLPDSRITRSAEVKKRLELLQDKWAAQENEETVRLDAAKARELERELDLDEETINLETPPPPQRAVPKRTVPPAPPLQVDRTEETQISRRAGWAMTLVGVFGVGPVLVGVGLLVGLVLGAGVVAAMSSAPQAPAWRPQSVVVAGVPSTVDTTVSVDGQAAASHRGKVFKVPGLEGRSHLVTVRAGKCGEKDPPSCCVEDAMTRTWTSEMLVVEVATLPPFDPIPVEFHLPRVGGRTVDIELGGRQADKRARRIWQIDAVPPGSYELHASIGRCSETARGCSVEGTCPDGCVSTVRRVKVPCGGRAVVDLSHLEPGAVDRPAQAMVIEADEAEPEEELQEDLPTEEPARAGPEREAGPRITNAEFAAFMKRKREWTKKRALAKQQVDSFYLETWDGNDPPSGSDGRYVNQVSFRAAKAFCASRGGLADIDDGPWTWFEDGAPIGELRADGGAAALRFSQGTTKRVSPTQTHARVGFRCVQ